MNINDPDQLRKMKKMINNRLADLESRGYDLFRDDQYEYLVIARLERMNEKMQDALDYAHSIYYKLTEKDKTFSKILKHFDGKTIKEKRRALFDFIDKNPVFRTAKPELLLQRLDMIKKFGDDFGAIGLSDTPIKDKVQELENQLHDEDVLT